MYGYATDEEMPSAFLTDPDAWAAYVGGVWGSVLPLCGFGGGDTLVELGPGSSVKIGHALSLLDFTGTLWVIEAAPAMLELLKPKYARLLPRAKVNFVCGLLKDSLGLLPEKIDGILGNHLFDDFLLATAASSADDTFQWAEKYGDLTEAQTMAAWSCLTASDARLAGAKKEVARDIMTAITRLSPRYIAFNQYPSSTLRDNGLDDLNRHAADILETVRNKCDALPQETLQQALSQNKNYGNAHIGNDVLNAAYWLLCRT